MTTADVDRAYRAALVLAGIIIAGLVLGASAGEEGVGTSFLSAFIPLLILAPVVLLISGMFAGLGPVLWVIFVAFVAKHVSLPAQYVGYVLVAHPAFVVPAAIRWFRTKR